MGSDSFLKRMLYNNMNTKQFLFENLVAPSMYSFITIQDIQQINSIVTSVKYTSKVKEKYAMIDSILKPRGFYKIGAGTNRVVYRHYEYPQAVLKVAVFRGALTDGINEIKSQYYLKPFCAKTFEVSPCGTVSWCEYVKPIKNITEFKSMSDDIYDIITTKIIGKYILDDFGTRYFMNWGLREGFGPVILDYPYVYRLDGSKLVCNRPVVVNGHNMLCDGLIDYDEGFNDLICTKCGAKFAPSELKTQKDENNIKIINTEEEINMVILLKHGNEVLNRIDTGVNSVDTSDKKMVKVKIVEKKAPKKFKRVDTKKLKIDQDKAKVKRIKRVLKNAVDYKHPYNQLDKMKTIEYSKVIDNEIKDEINVNITSDIFKNVIENENPNIFEDNDDDDYKDYEYYEKEFNLKPIKKSKSKCKLNKHENRFDDNSNNEYYLNQY